MDKSFRPKIGRTGGIMSTVQNMAVTKTLAANTTTTTNLGGPGRRAWAERLSVATFSNASTPGTATCTIAKRDTTGASTTLTASFDLVAGVTARNSATFTFLSTLTDQQRTLQAGDTLELVFVSNNATLTAPTDLRVIAEFLLLD